MNRRDAKFWIFSLVGSMIITWIWVLLDISIVSDKNPNAILWNATMMVSCFFSIAAFCFLMVYMYKNH